jgi:orotate phosphoribosyltransferase
MVEFSTISLNKNPLITLNISEGHFATTSAHFNLYLEMGELKYSSKKARAIAREIAIPYLTTTLVDTIVCMEGTEVIGAYLAEELTKSGNGVINDDADIYIIKPVRDNNRRLMFREHSQEMLKGKNVILLVASVIGGRTIDSASECIEHYGGSVVGISSLFTSIPENVSRDINTVFTGEDVPGYRSYSPAECELCQAKQKLDAFVTDVGFTRV